MKGFRKIPRAGAVSGATVLERLVRSGEISFSTAILYATNPGNLRVQLFDLTEDEPAAT